ncbi:MAG TPA: class I SAM-dependent methyltransferase [Gemmataceae bacterium]
MSARLHFWGPPAPRGREAPPPRAVPPMPPERVEQLEVQETLRPVSRRAEPLEPFSLPWFLRVEQRRYGRHAAWIPRLLEFARHPGERVLALGGVLGTDWVQYARNRAQVCVCGTSAEHLALVRRNFELRGLPGQFLHCPPASLPAESASVDVVALATPLPGGEPPAPELAEEIYRVLKPGGKVVALLPAYYDAVFWQTVLLPWRRWAVAGRAARRPESRCTARQLRALFGRFAEHRAHKRHLRRSDLPHLWRFLPLPLMERLMGRFLVFKAFKPLRAAFRAPRPAGAPAGRGEAA